MFRAFRGRAPGQGAGIPIRQGAHHLPSPGVAPGQGPADVLPGGQGIRSDDLIEQPQGAATALAQGGGQRIGHQPGGLGRLRMGLPFLQQAPGFFQGHPFQVAAADGVGKALLAHHHGLHSYRWRVGSGAGRSWGQLGLGRTRGAVFGDRKPFSQKTRGRSLGAACR